MKLNQQQSYFTKSVEETLEELESDVESGLPKKLYHERIENRVPTAFGRQKNEAD